MARDFSEDGALGAMTGAPGTQTGGFTSGSITPSTVNNFNMTGTPAGQGSTMPITTGLGDAAIGGGGWGGGGLDGGDDSWGGGAIADNGGGWGGGGLSGAPGGTRATRSPGSYSRDSYNFGAGGGGQLPSAAGAWGFAAGGAIDEDPNATDPQGSQMGASLQQSINQALSTVNNVLSYGRNLHGIGGGQKEAMNTDGFRQSDNIDDRTGTPGDEKDRGTPGAKPTYKRNPTEQLMDRVGSTVSSFTNPLSKAAGINDIGSSQSASSSDTADAAGAQQAIPTDEEEAQ